MTENDIGDCYNNFRDVDYYIFEIDYIQNNNFNLRQNNMIFNNNSNFFYQQLCYHLFIEEEVLWRLNT